MSVPQAAPACRHHVTMSRYQPRDFIETREGLALAVVDGRPEQGRILTSLRYRRVAGRWVKLATGPANAWLAEQDPGLIFHSPRLAARVHGVPIERVWKQHRPRERAAELMAALELDPIEAKARRCLDLFVGHGIPLDRIGMTGSLLIGAQHPSSDLDFVIYDRAVFSRARAIVRDAIAAGELSAMTPAAWRDAYARRGCDLSFEEYVWHERRKFTMGLCDGAKFDLALVTREPAAAGMPARKLGPIRLVARVLDADRAYDFPAGYRLDHPTIGEVLSFSHTYAGQARAGEWMEASGQLEEVGAGAGARRVIVGSSREAPGEFIRVLAHPPGGPVP